MILVGHSYGGAVISQAGENPKVVGLVYVAAFAPDVGQSVIDQYADIELLQASTVDAIAAGRPEEARRNAAAVFDAYRAGASAASRSRERSWASRPA